jgi:hypothetical protein
MMKFFRKYNKQLLAVFMVLLMVVFLGGSALYELASPNPDRTVATSRDGDISLMDQRVASQVTSLLSGIGFAWQQPVPGNYPALQEIDWLLLMREAERYGMASNEPAVRATLGANISLDDLSRNIGIRKDRIVEALAQFTAIQQLAYTIGEAATVSEAEILTAGELHLKKVRVNAVLLPGAAFSDPEAEFSEAEIREQYEKHRSAESGEGLNFGYYVPPKLKIQYVRIDVAKLADVVRIASLDKKARAFYDERPEQPAFLRPADEAPDSAAAPSTGRSPYLSWDEAKEIAFDIVRKREASMTAARMADWVVKTSAEPWHGIDQKENRYKVAPENIRLRDYFAHLLDNLPSSIAYREVISVEETDFVSREEVDRLPKIGTASYRGDSGGFSFKTLSTLAFQSEPIVEKIPEVAGASGGDFLSLHQTSRYPLTGFDGDVYAFRVVDHKPGHVPESVDEVRDAVVADMRLLEGFNNARWRAESLRACEDAANLKEAYEKDDELVGWSGTEQGAGVGFFEPPAFSLVSRYDAARGKSPDLVYVGAGVGSLPFEVARGCFALAGATQKIKIFEDADRAAVLVIEWVETIPAKGEDFLEMRESFMQQMARARSQTLIEQWLTPEQIRARTQFALITTN